MMQSGMGFAPMENLMRKGNRSRRIPLIEFAAEQAALPVSWLPDMKSV
jgi:hypothetical protein